MRVLWIDLGGSRAKIAIAEAGRITDMRILPVRSDIPVRPALDLVADAAESMPGTAECGAVGLAYPGIVDTVNQRVVCINDKYTDAAGTDFVLWARERFGLELRLMNDAAAALLGEMAYGAGRGYDSAVLLMVGTGVGTAVFSGGRLLTGKHGAMGILGGHIAIAHENARLCTCGSRGCLEAYAGTWALPGLAKEHPDYERSVLRHAERVDYQALAEGCAAGDAVCRDVFRDACRALCAGAANLVRAYDPALMILSGGASRIPALQAALKEHLARCGWTGPVPVRTAENPEASVVLGLSALFDNEVNDAFSKQL